MSVSKNVIMGDRLRMVPHGFGWIDHRFVRDRHIQGLSCEAMALYLFLVTVADGDGLSHWSLRSMSQLLNLRLTVLGEAKSELECQNLIAYAAPLWQVLSLPVRGGQ